MSMPLPRSAGIAARATDVYSETCPLVLQFLSSSQEKRQELLKALSSLLPFLRQLLTCCACASILNDAMISLSCGHCYCYKCQFCDPILKIMCRQCRERKGLASENQVRIIVKLYKELLTLLSLGDPIHNEPLQELLQEVLQNKKISRSVLMISPPQRYITIKQSTPKKEAQVRTATIKPVAMVTKTIGKGKRGQKRKHVVIEESSTEEEGEWSESSCDSDDESCDTDSMILEDDNAIEVIPECLVTDEKTNRLSHFNQIASPIQSSSKIINPLHTLNKCLTPFSPRIIRGRLHSPIKARDDTHSDDGVSNCGPHIVSVPINLLSASVAIASSHKTKKKSNLKRSKQPHVFSCRCGTNPGVMFEHLICAKRKCPCYLNKLPCTQCRCRGCCNPFNKQ